MFLADFSKSKIADEKRANRNKELRNWGGATLVAAGTGLASYPSFTGGLVYGVSGSKKQALKSAVDVSKKVLKHPIKTLHPKTVGGKIALGSLGTYGIYRGGKAIYNRTIGKDKRKTSKINLY